MFHLIQKSIIFISRGGWLIWVLLGCSVVSLAIIIERFIFFLNLNRFNTLRLMQGIFKYIKKGKIKEALKICGDNPYYITNIVGEGICRYSEPKEAIREAMENKSLYEIPKLEKNLSFLSTLAHISPLIGLLGTVMGLVKSFYVIEQKAQSAGMVNPSDIAGGIWEALLTTVAGLCIAIVSYLAYNYFVYKVNMYILEAEKASTELLEIVLENQKA
ncbi:MAG: hypothetical protein B1H08_02445 [Candidatus Omnitrophica bacterium 4484_171]|nr:MAG: hypothetical protein B1H08_02445 [Candidatus Omnitrophica bacterium 4484_171]